MFRLSVRELSQRMQVQWLLRKVVENSVRIATAIVLKGQATLMMDLRRALGNFFGL